MASWAPDLLVPTRLSKYVKAGLWRPEQISITDAVGNADSQASILAGG